MERDRATALSHFLKFLAGNPSGDAAARAMTTGTLSLLDVSIAQIYVTSREDAATLELVGSYGYSDDEAAAYRALPTGLPVPVCEAFVTMNAVVHRATEIPERYPMLAAEPSYTIGTLSLNPQAYVVCVPIFNSGVTIGVLDMVQDNGRLWDSTEWQYVEGLACAVGLWLNNQRQILVERWRRSAPTPTREVRVSERQRQILELIGEDRTNNEIARRLGYSVPTIKKDLQQIMRILGTEDRRTTAGRAREIGLLPERRQRD
jgi:DNA-binding CsgD family transcriptional regulator